MTPESTLRLLERLVGTWSTEGTHPDVAGIVTGTAVIEWLDGNKFLSLRTRADDPKFPASTSIIGFTDRDRAEVTSSSPLTMHYYDSRGVFREMLTTIDETAWRIWRDAPGFSQRFTGRFADGGSTIVGQWQLCRDDVHWNDDLAITYRRRR